MDTVQDFEDLLELFDRHDVHYLIIGGLAFIFHAKPRYTKDMDIWLDADVGNVERANLGLSEFGAPDLLDPDNPDEILQLGAVAGKKRVEQRVCLMPFPGLGRAARRFLDDQQRIIFMQWGDAHPTPPLAHLIRRQEAFVNDQVGQIILRQRP